MMREPVLETEYCLDRYLVWENVAVNSSMQKRKGYNTWMQQNSPLICDPQAYNQNTSAA